MKHMAFAARAEVMDSQAGGNTDEAVGDTALALLAADDVLVRGEVRFRS